MAVAYDSNGGGANATGSAGAYSVTTTYPATINANDLLIAKILCRAGTSVDSIATIADWTPIIDIGVGTTTASELFWKLATGLEDGTTDIFTGTYTGLTPRMACIIERYTGNVGSGTPVEAAATNSGTSTTPAPASVTITTSDGLIVCALGARTAATVGNITGESSGNYTEAYAEYTATTLMIQTQTSAGPTAAGGTCTLGSSTDWQTICFGIKGVASATGKGIPFRSRGLRFLPPARRFYYARTQRIVVPDARAKIERPNLILPRRRAA